MWNVIGRNYFEFPVSEKFDLNKIKSKRFNHNCATLVAKSYLMNLAQGKDWQSNNKLNYPAHEQI